MLFYLIDCLCYLESPLMCSFFEVYHCSVLADADSSLIKYYFAEKANSYVHD
jgi:hypothetical protein